MVDRSEVIRQWAAHTARHHPGDDGVEEWLVEWDCDGDTVRDRREFLDGVRTRLGMRESVDGLLQRWPHELGSHHRMDEATQNVLRSTGRQGIPMVIVTNGLTAHQQAKLDAISAHDLVDG